MAAPLPQDQLYPLVLQGWLLATEQQAHLQDLVAEQDWEVDMSAGTLTFGGELSVRMEVLGSWAHADDTFLWAWANAASGLPDHVLAQARLVQSWADQLPFLGERLLSASHDDAFVLSIALSGVLPEVRALYRAPHGGGAVFLVITDPAMDLPPPTTLRSIRVISEGLNIGLPDHQGALRHYFQHRGFSLTEGPEGWSARHPGGAEVNISFDEEGRIAQLTGEARPS